MSRFQGRSAEKAFSKLCSDNGVTCNAPTEDDHGWDHIVEFPHKPLPGVSADMQNAIPAIFVQTKSHVATGRKITMKLSNALKLARSPSPVFVLLSVTAKPGQSSATEWFARHFWGDLIFRTLKRAREATRDNIEEEEFHDRTFSFTMSENDRMPDEMLLPWMESSVMAVGAHYASAKNGLCAGHEIVGKVSFTSAVSIDQLVEHSLGLTQNITVKALSISHRRFGVDLPFKLPLPNEEGIQATFHAQPSAQCDIRMRGPDGVLIEVQGDIIGAGIPGIPDDHKKIRIRAPFLDMIMNMDGSAKLTAQIDSDLRKHPKDIEDMVRFASWSDQGDIDFRATVRDEPLFFGTANLRNFEGRSFCATLAPQLEVLSEVSNHLKIKKPMISMNDILQSEDFFDLYRFIRGVDLKVDMTLFPEHHYPDVHEMVASGAASVGDWIFAAIQRYEIIQKSREGDDVTLNLGDPRVLHAYAFRNDDANALNQLEADLWRHVNKKGVFGASNILTSFKVN